MRFIREIISEKRGTPTDRAGDLPVPHAGGSRPEPPGFDVSMSSLGQATDPLPLDRYQVRQDAHFEDEYMEADDMLVDQSKEDIVHSALDHPEDSNVDDRQEMKEDTCEFDDEGDEDYFEALENSGLNGLEDIADPFEKLREEITQNSVTSRNPNPVKSSEPYDILGMDTQVPLAVSPAESPVDETSSVEVPAPTAGRGSSRSGRVKTRLLGFSAGSLDRTDMFEKGKDISDSTFPVGWLVVVSELGRGTSFALHDGVSKVGRGTDQTVCLNFGDNSISRDNHLSIAYDAEQNKFFIGHSGKSNLVRLNNKPLLSTEELRSRDQIRLGETTLRFVALCEDNFTWTMSEAEAVKRA